MLKRCVLCRSKLYEEFGKLDGTIIKARNEKKVDYLIYVCSNCMKKDSWIENAKIKAA